MLQFILLQAEGQQSGWSFWIMMGLICVVFYFFMIRPQAKKQKELQRQRDALKKGDKVITNGGIYGVIKEVRENIVLLEITKEVVIRVDKSCLNIIAPEDKSKDEGSKPAKDENKQEGEA